MPPLLLFIFLLLLTFGVLIWALKPTRSEADIQRHMTTIGRLYAVDTEGVTILKQETLSSIPWLNDILHDVPGCIRLRLFIVQAGCGWSVSVLLIGSVLAALITGWVSSLFVPQPFFAVLFAVAVGSVPYVYLLVARGMRFTRFETILPPAIDLMSRALKAGHAVTSVIEMVALETAEPVAWEFRTVFEEQNLGLPIREAILNLAQRVPIDDVRMLATAILVQKETGGNLAEILDKTAAIMRERSRLKGQLRIYTAQGRVTGIILCSLPFIMFIVLNIVNHDYEKILYTDPMGIHAIYAGLIMMAIGIFAVRKIISIKV
jgi:tight adherence protein B